MKNRVRFFFLFLGLLGALAVHAQINELPRSTPEAEGVPSKAVTALFDSLMALPKTDIHSVVVVRHGKVIGEIYPAPFALQDLCRGCRRAGHCRQPLALDRPCRCFLPGASSGFGFR